MPDGVHECCLVLPGVSPPQRALMQHDGLVHQTIELTEELVDFVERRLFFDQLLYMLTEACRHCSIDVNLALSVLVDNLIAARLHREVAVLRWEFDDTVVGAVVDHLHGDTP